MDVKVVVLATLCAALVVSQIATVIHYTALVDEKSRAIDMLGNQITNKDNTISSLNSQVSKLQGEVFERDRRIDELSSKILNMSVEIATLNTKLSVLEEQLRDRENTIATLNNQISERDRQIQTLTLQLEKLRAWLEGNRTLYETRVQQLSIERDRLLSWLVNNITIYERRVSGLVHNLTDLKDRYSELLSMYNSLKLNYSNLSNLYESLKQNYTTTRIAYEKLFGIVLDIVETLRSYTTLPDAFPRVLNDDAVRSVRDAVYSAGVSVEDFWYSLQRIYEWIVNNINYAQDVEMPYPIIWFSEVNGTYIPAFYFTITIRAYVQHPNLTLTLRQGDCEDQAVLAYAMIEYYWRYLLGKDNILYIALIEFNSGTTHVALFLPVKGGKLTIIDPAGGYLTTLNGEIWAFPVLGELQNYSNYWSSEGGISWIKLYRVDTVDGSYTLDAEGDIQQIAQYIQSLME